MDLKSLTKKEKIIFSVILIACLLSGFGGGYLTSSATGKEYVRITSIEDGQEVHSTVVIDAATYLANEVVVKINGTVVSNYLPFYWNNMLEPVGTYVITVGVRINQVWRNDTKTVVIPETFIVPSNYEFTEDFVVHTGQTVYFQDKYFYLSQEIYSNGATPLDEKTYYSVNNFGTLYLINARIICLYFRGEENSGTYLETGSHIIQKGYYDLGIEKYYSNAPMFDDTAKLYHDETETWTSSYMGNDITLVYPDTSHYYILMEGSSLKTWIS